MIALALDVPRSANPINHYILSWREGEYQAGSSAANVTRNPCSNRRSPGLALRRRRSRAGNHARAAAGVELDDSAPTQVWLVTRASLFDNLPQSVPAFAATALLPANDSLGGNVRRMHGRSSRRARFDTASYLAQDRADRPGWSASPAAT